MKKIASIIAAVLMSVLLVFSIASCGGSEKNHNEITDLYDQGYTNTSSTWYDDLWAGIFTKEDSWDKVYFVKADLNNSQAKSLDDLEWDDPNYDKKKQEILNGLSNVVVKDITDMIPDETELNSYVGKTIGDLEDLEFENSGYIGEPEEGYRFFYDGPIYSIIVSPAEDQVIKDLDDYSANDLRKIVIGKVEFSGLSYKILDTLLAE